VIWSSNDFDLNPEGKRLLIQSPSPDWIKRKYSSAISAPAVNLILREEVIE
jgi:hypothetical protein